MLKLKNVSKFYYNKGMVSSGFTKVNLELNIGEFVAITGESGSGKSTLLNVISGLDTYEEGQMYINGIDTSAYTEIDFENYRRKYIANIFQNFNLVLSYSVYQNVELILLVNGYSKKEAKPKVLDALEKVDLLKYKNTKASKLSGGQKQRVAIARALVKDTPIIVTDEPTGNLDLKAAENVMELLSRLSKDRLVIVVTHNYEQAEPYVTRKITMHDGKIVEDKTFEVISEEEVEDNDDKNIVNEYKKMGFINKLRLGIRNTFNIIPKFILLLIVFLFLTVSVAGSFSSSRQQKYEESKLGFNNFFHDTSEKRVIIKKKDKTAFTDEDYKKIENIKNVDYIVKDDLLLDTLVDLYNNDYYFYGSAADISGFNGKITYGRMPKNNSEVILELTDDSYYLSSEDLIDSIFEGEYSLQDDNSGEEILEYKSKITGIAVVEESDIDATSKFYVSEKVLDDIRKNINSNYSEVTTTVNGNVLKQEAYASLNKVVPNSKVPKGKAIVSEDMAMYYKNFKCVGKNITVKVKNIYFQDSVKLKITKTYNSKNFKKVTGKKDYDMKNGEIYINPKDYYALYNKGNFQSSVYLKDDKKAQATAVELQNIGLETLCMKDSLVNYMGDFNVIVNGFRFVINAIMLVGLFFIIYFIIKLILKSRNIYFSTVRILGATRKNAQSLLNIELFTVLNIAYVIFVSSALMVKNGIIHIEYLYNLMSFLQTADYIKLYVLLVIMCLFISARYAKQLFTKSAMNTYREEV